MRRGEDSRARRTNRFCVSECFKENRVRLCLSLIQPPLVVLVVLLADGIPFRVTNKSTDVSD